MNHCSKVVFESSLIYSQIRSIRTYMLDYGDSRDK